MDGGPHDRPERSGNERRRGYYRPAVWLLGLTAAAVGAGFVESKAGLPAADTYSLAHILGVSAVAAGLGGALLDFTDNHPAD